MKDNKTSFLKIIILSTLILDYSEEDEDDDEVLKLDVETRTFTQEIQVSETRTFP